jgi:hypothetical protein
MSGDISEVPPIVCGMRPHPDEDYLLWSTNYRERAKEYFNHTNDNYNVQIGGFPRLGDIWSIYSKTTDTTKDRGREFINCNLKDIYNYIYYDILNNEIFSYGSELRDFKPSDLTAENILDSVKDLFVFLKPGETFIDTYNLVAFKIVEGCFTFFIGQEDIKNYVLYQEHYPEMKRIVDIEHELPTIVGEYHHYSGAFNTNKVTVCFGERE